MTTMNICDFPACRHQATVRFTIEEFGDPFSNTHIVDGCSDHAPMFKYGGDKEDPDFLHVEGQAA